MTGPRDREKLAAVGICARCHTAGQSHKKHTYAPGCAKFRPSPADATQQGAEALPMAMSQPAVERRSHEAGTQTDKTGEDDIFEAFSELDSRCTARFE